MIPRLNISRRHNWKAWEKEKRTFHLESSSDRTKLKSIADKIVGGRRPHVTSSSFDDVTVIASEFESTNPAFQTIKKAASELVFWMMCHIKITIIRSSDCQCLYFVRCFILKIVVATYAWFSSWFVECWKESRLTDFRKEENSLTRIVLI